MSVLYQHFAGMYCIFVLDDTLLYAIFLEKTTLKPNSTVIKSIRFLHICTGYGMIVWIDGGDVYGKC